MSSASRSRPSRSRFHVGKLSFSMNAAQTFLGKQLWTWPLIAALLLAGAGWWVARVIRGVIAEQVSGQIQGIRDAEVIALKQWLRNQEAIAETAAADNDVVKLAAELVTLGETQQAPTGDLLKSNAVQAFRQQLAPMLAAHQLCGYFLAGPGLRVVAAAHDGSVGITLDGYRKQVFQKALAGKSIVSHPYPALVPLPDERGELRASLPTMFSAAPIRSADGTVIAALGLRIRPEREFTKILRVAKYGQTGETYALNRSGLFLSCSRFDDELKRVGLVVDQPTAASILTLEARNPGVNMLTGDRPSERRNDQPLTTSAAAVTRGETGVEVAAYPDYRGVPVVGAWAWLPEYEFGIVSEVDEAEAFCALTILRSCLFGLIGLLALAALAIFVFMIKNARQQRKLREAVLANRQLGQYTLEDKIGAGGMGTVYRARHALLRRPTAVKLLALDKVNEGAIGRFEREVQLTSQLNHPNTVAVFDYGRTPEGVFYYAMEYLDGITLEELGERFGPQPDGRVVSILQQVCGSLAEAHAAGMIHRDIKPANILLNYRGGEPDVVKVLDFGLAKLASAEESARLTSVGAVVGTPLYLAPEAISGRRQVDLRADLYAVGGVGYFLLTGQSPFTGDTVARILQNQLNATPEAPSERRGSPVNPRLEALILRCLAKKPEDRPASATEVLIELQACGITGWSRAAAEAWWQTHRPQNVNRPAEETAADSGARATAAFVPAETE